MEKNHRHNFKLTHIDFKVFNYEYYKSKYNDQKLS